MTAKSLALQRLQGYDGDGNPLYANGFVSATYAYDSAGRTISVSYPVADRTPGYNAPVTFMYGFDTMGRPVALTDNTASVSLVSSTTWAQGVTYDFAGRMTQMKYPKYTSVSGSVETKSLGYDAKTGSLTSVSWGENFNTGAQQAAGLQYTYSPTQNNGQITQVTDSISGETVSYQYDSLKRLASASSTPTTGSSTPAWTQTFSYDGFGNLAGRVTNGTAYPISIDSAHNQQSGAGYDLNGNITESGSIAYDVSNRMLSYANGSAGTEYYGYAPDNKRIYRKKAGSGGEEWTFYGAHGEKLGTWVFGSRWDEASQANVVDFHASASNVWFAGQLISDGNSVCSGGNCTRAVFQDRLGTNRASGARFYPYGDEITSSSNDREKFGTYNRDGFSGLDYAVQRYYASAYGRFNTPDPMAGSAIAANPGTWNRYAYVGSDPVNHRDPRGLNEASVDCEDDGEGGCIFRIDAIDENSGGGGGSIDPCMLMFLTNPTSNCEGSYLQKPFPFPPPRPYVQATAAQESDFLGAADKLAQAALAKPECADLFNIGGVGLSPDKLLTAIENNDPSSGQVIWNDIGDSGIAATTSKGIGMPNADGTISKTAVITLNDNLNSILFGGGATGGAAMLLHELGHAYEFIYGAASSAIKGPDGNLADPVQAANQDNNNSLISKNCF